jgi:hypothetical protein
MMDHFCQRHWHKARCTWQQQRKGRIVYGRNDAIMASDRRYFTNLRIIVSPGCESDHYMLVATMQTDLLREHQKYLWGRKQATTANGHDFGPTETVDQLFTNLLQHCAKSTPQYHPTQKDWISDKTWRLLKQKAALGGRSNQGVRAKRRQLKNQIRTSLNRDRRRRASVAGAQIQASLETNDVRGAFATAKRWYTKVTGRSPPPAREDLETTAVNFESLYAYHSPEDGLHYQQVYQSKRSTMESQQSGRY